MLQSEKIAGLQLKIHNMCHKNSGTPELDPLEIKEAVTAGGIILLSESH